MEMLEPKKQRINLSLKNGLYDSLKKEAINNKTSVTSIINSLVEDHYKGIQQEATPEHSQESKYYTIGELEELLQLSDKTIISYITSGKLKGYKLGKNYRVAASDLNIFLERNRA